MSQSTTLSKEIIEMWNLVCLQHEKTLTAFLNFDLDLAREVVLIEERVDSSEQLIDTDCAHFLHYRLQTEPSIPFVIHIMKINRQLERIGDIAEAIVTDLLAAEEPFSDELVEEVQIVDLYRKCLRMLEMSLDAFATNDRTIAQVVLSRVEVFQDQSAGVNVALTNFLKLHPEQLKPSLNIFSIVKSLENLVDQIQTLAVELLSFEQKGVPYYTKA